MNKDDLNEKESCDDVETQLAEDLKSFLNVDVSKQVFMLKLNFILINDMDFL